MKIDDAAKKWDVSRDVVLYLIRKGRIPAKYIKKGTRDIWDIPDDLPYPGRKYKAKQQRREAEKAERSNIGKRKYIKKYAGTFSIEYIAQCLDISCDKVRWIYDDIVAKGGV